MIKEIEEEFKKVASKKEADHGARFFKTGKGEYGEGDLFLGVSNPDIHRIANKYKREISMKDTLFFLRNKVHDFRVFALDILKYKYSKGDSQRKKEIVDVYLDNKEYINNWDLVDISAPHILGDYLLDKDRDVLYQFAKTDHLWTQRIAILSTFAFIRNNEYKDALEISEMLLNHQHDLIHKAVGWMLREIWKRDSEVAEKFIKDNYDDIPRTALRYSIERMEGKKRKMFLNKGF
jgi:3-methyladenine DNA glycosylase AlkD